MKDIHAHQRSHARAGLAAQALAGAALAVLAAALPARAQAPPDLEVSEAQVVQLPPDGVLHYGSVTIHANGVLSFERNATNTPVQIFATGPISVETGGLIHVDGGGTTTANPGAGGPGGFDGGLAGFGAQGIAPGNGYGPGGGRGGFPHFCCETSQRAGHGAFGCDNDGHPPSGTPYGNPVLLSLIGGSGGGGQDQGVAGGGGGGAILLASDVSVEVNGHVRANGGDAYYSGDGSGGAIRLLAPIVRGTGTLEVGGHSSNHGRIRVDALDRSHMAFNLSPACAFTVGAIMVSSATGSGALRIVEVGGEGISDEATGPVFVNLGPAAPKRVKVRVSGYGGVIPVEITLTPDQGLRVAQTVNADMSTADQDGNVVITATFDDFPTNVATRVDAWTR